MKKMMLLMLMFLALGTAGMKAQVRIGDANPPTAGAVLDLNASIYKGGLLLPKVALNTTADLSNIASPHASNSDLRGLIVYAYDGTVPEGIYLWNGSSWNALWVKPAI